MDANSTVPPFARVDAGPALLFATLFEIAVMMVVAIMFVSAAWSYTLHGSLLLTAFLLVLALYGAGLFTLGALGVAFRLCPFDRNGPAVSPRDQNGFMLAVALSNFLFRSLGAPLLASPYIATWFYRLSGSRLAGPIMHGGKMPIFDPWGVDCGRNVIIGVGARVFSHLNPGNGPNFAHTVTLGDDVVVGVSSVVMPGAIIGAGAIILPNSTVTSHTVVGANELWGGSPAKFIKDKTHDRA